MERFENLRSDHLEKLGSTQVAVECNMLAREGTRIEKLLTTGAVAVETSVEALSGEAVVAGRANFKVAYVDENGELRSLDYNSEFKARVVGEFVAPSMKLTAIFVVEDLTTTSRSDTEVKLTAVIRIEITGVVSKDYEVLVYQDELCSKEGTAISTNCIGMSESVFEISEEFESGSPVKSIMLMDSSAIIEKVKSGQDSVTVSGEAYVTVVFDTGEGVESTTINVAFNEEMFVDGAMPGNTAHATVSVNKVRMILTGDESNTTMKVELSLKVKTMVFSSMEFTIIEDAYCTDCILELSKNEHKTYSDVLMKCYEKEIEGTVELSELNANIKLSIARCARGEISNLAVYDGKIVIDGIIIVNAIYKTEEGGYRAVELTIPYYLDIQDDDIEQGYVVDVQMAVARCEIIVEEGKANIKCTLKIACSASKIGTCTVITGLNRGTERTSQHSPISLYRAEAGETMWNIAKALGVTTEELAKSNPNVSTPLAGGELLLTYKQLFVV